MFSNQPPQKQRSFNFSLHVEECYHPCRNVEMIQLFQLFKELFTPLKAFCDLTFSSCGDDTAVIFTWPNGSVIVNRQLAINKLVYCAKIATDLSIEAKNNQQTSHFKTDKHRYKVLQFVS